MHGTWPSAKYTSTCAGRGSTWPRLRMISSPSTKACETLFHSMMFGKPGRHTPNSPRASGPICLINSTKQTPPRCAINAVISLAICSAVFIVHSFNVWNSFACVSKSRLRFGFMLHQCCILVLVAQLAAGFAVDVLQTHRDRAAGEFAGIQAWHRALVASGRPRLCEAPRPGFIFAEDLLQNVDPPPPPHGPKQPLLVGTGICS